MLQELDFSLSGNTAKTVRASICKIAFKTIPRCGIAALILLCMGFYFLFPACQTFQQIQTEKNTPYELAASTDNSNIDLNTLMQIEGVAKISPVLNLNARLSLDEYNLDCEIRAVYSSFLSLKFIQGTMYPDSSNMPYLILNKAAAKAFSHEYQTITVSPEDTVMINVNGTDRKAIVCGIFDDGSEVPIIYMSYDAAQNEYGHNGQTELIFLLADKGAAEDVVSALQRQNIYANFDSTITLAWELLQKQCWQTMLLSIGLLACAVVLIGEKRQEENRERKSELTMLILSGMTGSDIKMIFPIRVIFLDSVCLAAAITVSGIAGSFSFFAILIGIGFASIHCIATVMEKTSY